MTYKIPKPKKEKESIDSFGIENLNDWDEKEEKSDSFKTENPTDEKEEHKELFQQSSDEQEAIDEINNDLFSEQTPIEIKDKYTLIVKASGKEHEITRKDYEEYQKKYGYEGEEGRDISGYRQLGTIGGDWRPIDAIAQDVNSVFGRIDDKLGAYKTAPSEED
jgi:hypothetical protein